LSRFFKYKTAEDLDREIEASGLSGDLGLQDDWSPLLQPVVVGGRRVGNRLAIQPMEGCDGTSDGCPDELTFRRYRRFGAGGAKLIWGEAAAVVPEARANTRQLVCDTAHTDGLARLVEVTRSAHRDAWQDDSDLLVGLQLTHSGRYSVPYRFYAQHDPILDPRTGATPSSSLLSDDDLDRLLDRYVEAAGVAMRAGFDFIDIKQCHRYLLNELLSAGTRPGKYGGSFENRTRFVADLASRIRDEFPGLILGSRLNVYDAIPYQKRSDQDETGVPSPFAYPLISAWGTQPNDYGAADPSEPLQLIALLKRLGVSIINVTMGNPYANPHVLRPFEYAPPDGYQTPEHPLEGVARHVRLTAIVQQAFPDLPVVGSGYSWLQAWMFHVGAANVAAKKTTFMGVGRASLSHPDFARRVLEGQPLDPRRTCRTFSYCTALMRSKHHPLGQFPTGCPPFDKETYGPIWKAASDKPSA
jgi:2,4-dienoyl-CoA reductase-like NADH-dependent reductase (Old Yellow Enzyme family)